MDGYKHHTPRVSFGPNRLSRLIEVVAAVAFVLIVLYLFLD